MDNQSGQDRYIGIDVGKDRIEVHIRPDNVGFGCATDAASLENLCARQGKETLLKSIPGVGDVVARTFIAELPELGTVDRHRIAALVGVAPINRDSGQYRGKRKIRGGRPLMRAPLYVACLSVIQCNKPLRAFYRHLLERGKEKKVALVAVMHKLVVIANAMLRDGQLRTETQAPAMP